MRGKVHHRELPPRSSSLSDAAFAVYRLGMPEEPTAPSHVLSLDGVRWSIDQLGDRRIHPAFIYYLYLRKMNILGRLSEATATSPEITALLKMPGGPENRPYYRPLRERGNRPGVRLRSFWMQPNVSGSWSPASLRRIEAASWLVNASDRYVLPDNHADLAKTNLLFNAPVLSVAMGGYFLRNDGFILDGTGSAEDINAAFRRKFLFEDSGDEFSTLFDDAVPATNFAWFDVISVPPVDAPDLPTELGGE